MFASASGITRMIQMATGMAGETMMFKKQSKSEKERQRTE